MPWVDVEEEEEKQTSGRWVDVDETPMDKLNKSGDFLKHFKRIPEAYNEEINSGLNSMREGNIVEKGLGALQYLTAPLNAPFNALVGEPVQSIAEQVGVPRNIAKPLGMVASVGVGFVPTKATSLAGKVANMAGIGSNYQPAVNLAETLKGKGGWDEFSDFMKQPEARGQFTPMRKNFNLAQTKTMTPAEESATVFKKAFSDEEKMASSPQGARLLKESLARDANPTNLTDIPELQNPKLNPLIDEARRMFDRSNPEYYDKQIKGLKDRIKFYKGIPDNEARPFDSQEIDNAYKSIAKLEEMKKSLPTDLKKEIPIGRQKELDSILNKSRDSIVKEFGSDITPEELSRKLDLPVETTSKILGKEILPEHLQLTVPEIKLIKQKPIQKDMFEVIEGTMEGKIPAKESEFALGQATEEARIRRIEAEMNKKQLNISEVNRGPQNIITWIKSKGGIDYLKEEWNGEIDIALENQPTLKNAINKKGGGHSLDELAMKAHADGWIKEPNKQELINAIESKKIRSDIIENRIDRSDVNADFLGMQSMYEKIVNNPNPFKPEKQSFMKSFGQKADELAGMVSTRIGNISPELQGRMRKYVFDEGLNTANDLKAITPFYQKFNKLPKQEQFNLTELLSNGKIREAESIFMTKGMLPDFRMAEKTKNALWQKAKESGLEAGDIMDHFPRKVSNYDELKKALGSEQQSLIDRSIQEMEQKAGRTLSIDEKSKVANNVLRGYDPARLGLSGPGFAKERKIGELTPELTQYYAPAHDALKDYVESLNKNIASNKLFGKDPGGDVLSKMGIDTTDQSIGSLIQQLKMQGTNISASQESQLRNMLSAVVKPKPSGKFTQGVKDITYATTLTNVGPALTQIQDLTFALEKEGFVNSIKGLAKSIVGKQEVTIKDLGIERIAEEMKGTKTPVDWLLKQGLKWSGFNAIDRLGKETLINGGLYKYQKMAQNNPVKLAEKIKPLFAGDTARVINDLKNKNITGDVKFLLFNELSDVQPISRLEVPEKYLTSDSGKIFYALKTYQLKLFDVYRRDIFQEIKKGNVKEGLGKLGRLTAGLVLLGAGTDEIKDFVFHRKTDFSDKVIDNFLKLGGFSKYTTWQARKEGVGKAFTSMVAPPLGVVTDIGKDVGKLYDERFANTRDKQRNARKKGFETIKDIPLAGKPYYWWLGEGARKEAKKQKKKNY